MKFGVIVFPGSNCDRDIATVTKGVLNADTRMVWHQETDLRDLDVVVVPGGFSYGDYLRCGAIAQFSPVMNSIIEHAKQGKYVLGICNGFQILTEVGLLPGALIRNRGLHFICDRVPIKIERNDLIWTKNYQTRVITLPIAHGEGCYYAEEDTLKAIEDNDRVLFRYSSASGEINADNNRNGSMNSIAGIVNQKGNVLGLMPHPERAADKNIGGTDGLPMFQGLLNALATA